MDVWLFIMLSLSFIAIFTGSINIINLILHNKWNDKINVIALVTGISAFILYVILNGIKV